MAKFNKLPNEWKYQIYEYCLPKNKMDKVIKEIRYCYTFGCCYVCNRKRILDIPETPARQEDKLMCYFCLRIISKIRKNRVKVSYYSLSRVLKCLFSDGVISLNYIK